MSMTSYIQHLVLPNRHLSGTDQAHHCLTFAKENRCVNVIMPYIMQVCVCDTNIRILVICCGCVRQLTAAHLDFFIVMTCIPQTRNKPKTDRKLSQNSLPRLKLLIN